MTHSERAQQLLHQQYHCSQALFGAFAADLGLDLRHALKLSSCLGGGMHHGGTCGCITSALLVLGMTLGSYDPQDRAQETYRNEKTEEFIRLFTERMNGSINCRDILGRNISNLEEMAAIRQEGMILQKCPKTINICIELLEEMFDRHFKYQAENSIELEDIPKDKKITSMLEIVKNTREFRRNVNYLLFSSSKEIAFIQFDIQKFKIVNDLYGEEIGDEILDFIRNQLRETCNENQFFSHLRCDLFLVVTEYDSEETLIEFIRLLDEKINCFKNIKLQMSYGVYIVEDRRMELRQMADRAAMARNAAKQNLLTNISFYKESFKDFLYNRKFIEENMQAAITERQFIMYLQPKYSVMKNKIIGAEALIRWHHPKHGMIYPDQFIPVIEENGFIKKADYYIWEEACRFLKRCIDAGISCCPISVNMSRVHLEDNECLEMISDLIKKYDIPKKLLEIEITETIDNQQVSMKVLQMKEEGYTLLMDDFGNGFSSLGILADAPFDVIKLDKKLVENMILSDRGKIIMEQVVLMADRLHIGILAEGVETKEQVEQLQRLGCDQVQGFYYARPMPNEEFFTLLRKQSSVTL